MTQAKCHHWIWHTLNASSVAVLLSVVPKTATSQDPLQAQSSPLATADLPALTPKRSSTAVEQQPDVRVTLNVKDSSISYVVLSLARQANLRIAYDNENPIFAKRITVNVSNAPIMDAMSKALQGSGLTARLATDGGAILIRAETGVVKPSEQTGTISGRVVDSATKKGIVGATVLLNGTKSATSTGEDGTFTLARVSIGSHSISIRLIGYQTRTLSVTVDTGKTVRVVVSLQQTSTTLTEIVTTATGKQRRAEVSNDVIMIDADKLIQAAPVRSVTDLLVAAQVPGMIVTRSSGEPGASTRIRLGGAGSISQSNDPVVIVDGVWLRSETSDTLLRRAGSGGSGLSARLDAIDPTTIETIEIVRGPSAATLYGPDAANGVIMITTKRGKAGPARWDFSYSRDSRTPIGQKPLLYTGYGSSRTSDMPRICTLGDAYSGVCTLDSISVLNPNSSLASNEGRAITNGYNLTVSGGSSQVTYSLTGSMRDELGVRRIPGADLVRLRQLNVPVTSIFSRPSKKTDRSLSSRTVIAPSPALDISLNVEGSQTDSRENSLGARLTTNQPFNATDTSSTLVQPSFVDANEANSTTTRGLISVSARWNPTPWWSGTFTTGLDRGFTRDNTDSRRRTCVDRLCGMSADATFAGNYDYSVYTIRAQSTFIPSLGWANRFLSVRPGVTMDLRRESREQENVNFPASGVPTAVRALGPTRALAGIGVNTYIRLFDRISFDPGFRRDFGNGHNLQNNAKTYPRFGSSWVISDESFFPKLGWMNSLRLRGALGYAAVQPNLSAVRGTYYWQDVMVNGQILKAIRFDAPGNTRLQPERSFEIEYGFDADLIDDRVTLIVTSANKRNSNTLINRTMAPSAGGAGSAKRQENVAKVVNRRMDVQLSARIVERPGFTARISGNISGLDNVVKTLGDGVSPFGTNEQRYASGYPVGGLWLKPILGINDRNENGVLEPGEYKLGDTAVYVGTNLPKYTAGYNIEIGLLGMMTINTMFDYKGRYMQNRAADYYNMLGNWDPQSSISEQARPVISQNRLDMQNISEMRFQSASVALNVPVRYVRRFKAQSLQVSLQGSNLGLWTQYRGRDPGVNSSPLGERTTDNGTAIPMPRQYSLNFRFGY